MAYWYVNNDQELVRSDFLDIPEDNENYPFAEWEVINNELKTGLMKDIPESDEYADAVWRVEDDVLRTRIIPDIETSSIYAKAVWRIEDEDKLVTGLMPPIETRPDYAYAVWRVEDFQEENELRTGLMPEIPPLDIPDPQPAKVLFTGANPPETTKVVYNYYFKETLDNPWLKRQFIYKEPT